MPATPTKTVFTLLAVVAAIAMEGCASRGVSLRGPVTVAVWPFEDLSPGTTPRDPALLALFTDAAFNAVLEDPALEAVERGLLEEVLREQTLGTGALADEASRLRLGRILGARWMLFGAWQEVGDGARLDIRLVDVETGRLLAAENGVFTHAVRSELVGRVREVARGVLSQAKRRQGV